jgi:hypothetical protein
VQQDRSPDDLRVGPWIPTQRTESTGQTPPPPNPLRPPGSPVNEETVVLPVFVTGKKPEQPPAQRAMAETTLPSSERGMLLFVAALLGLGTIAVVAMMGFGLGGSGGTKPKSAVAATTSRTPAGAPPAPSDATVPSPTAASPSRPAPSRSPARRSPTPGPTSTFLGNLSNGDVVSYCQHTNNGMPWPPGRGRNSWNCVADHGQRQEFAPADVCQWRYRDGGARATIGDLTTPSTWRCYT